MKRIFYSLIMFFGVTALYLYLKCPLSYGQETLIDGLFICQEDNLDHLEAIGRNAWVYKCSQSIRGLRDINVSSAIPEFQFNLKIQFVCRLNPNYFEDMYHSNSPHEPSVFKCYNFIKSFFYNYVHYLPKKEWRALEVILEDILKSKRENPDLNPENLFEKLATKIKEIKNLELFGTDLHKGRVALGALSSLSIGSQIDALLGFLYDIKRNPSLKNDPFIRSSLGRTVYNLNNKPKLVQKYFSFSNQSITKLFKAPTNFSESCALALPYNPKIIPCFVLK